MRLTSTKKLLRDLFLSQKATMFGKFHRRIKNLITSSTANCDGLIEKSFANLLEASPGT
jgi:hypothetical protein